MDSTYSAYAHGVLTKFAEHGVDPVDFVNAAKRTQDPVAIKVARIITAYAEKTAGLTDAPVDERKYRAAVAAGLLGPLGAPLGGGGLKSLGGSLGYGTLGSVGGFAGGTALGLPMLATPAAPLGALMPALGTYLGGMGGSAYGAHKYTE